MESKLFIGFKIPRKIIEIITMIRSTLNNDQKFYNWVSGNNLHLTLLFLGNHGVDQIDNLSEKIDSTMNEFGDFIISINGTGSFGNKNQILWLGVDKGQDQLQRINYELQIQLENYLDNQIKSKFAPHITIGRKKKTEISNNIDVKNFMNSVYFPMEFHVKYFTLFESIAIDRGVRYAKITNFPLQ